MCADSLLTLSLALSLSRTSTQRTYNIHTYPNRVLPFLAVCALPVDVFVVLEFLFLKKSLLHGGGGARDWTCCFSCTVVGVCLWRCVGS